MVTSEFVQNAFLAATGKVPTFAEDSPKWKNFVALGNLYIRRWAREEGIDWFSLYDPAYSLGNISATDSYDIDSEIKKLSQNPHDCIRINHKDSTAYTEYTLISADELKRHSTGNYVAKIGSTLRFNKKFTTTSSQFAGELTVPAFLHPKQLEGADDPIPIDDPDWLVLVVAAAYVKNDVTRKDLRADLIDEANAAMMAMKADNESQINDLITDWNPLGHIDA